MKDLKLSIRRIHHLYLDVCKGLRIVLLLRDKKPFFFYKV